MNERITLVGMDVHKNSIQVAMLLPGSDEPVAWSQGTDADAIGKLMVRLVKKAPGPMRCCYEAGPTGYALQRTLTRQGIDCMIVAPSLIPIRPGSRVKTDRRDAAKLAELFRAGLLSEVHPPDEMDEALRDLFRCRDDARGNLIQARHRMGKFLLRRNIIYRETKHHWGTRHMAWLRALSFADRPSQAVFESYLLTIDQLSERLTRLDTELAEAARQERYRESVARLRCFRGIDTLTAVGIVAELHDFRRFESPRRLMGYLGLVPSERSTGERERKGPITRSGNRHVRRLLIEASWHHRYKPRVTGPLLRRREGQPAHILALADRAQERLYARYLRMAGRGKEHNKTVTAMARELAGYIWAALHPDAAPMLNG